jgi:flagellar assembly protein FliH
MIDHSTNVVEPYEFTPSETPSPLPWTGVASLSGETDVEISARVATRLPEQENIPRQQHEIEQTMARRFEEGRHAGFEEGRKAERDGSVARSCAEDAQRKDHIASLVGRFDNARQQYLQDAEHEVVELALAVAARILRRESQMDPLLLTGAVRVALGQLATSTAVRLLVPVQDEELWKEAVAHVPHLAVRPEVVGDQDLSAGDCRIETEIGSVDLGLRSQLGEIEHGFFDRAHTPRTVRNRPEELERSLVKPQS